MTSQIKELCSLIQVFLIFSIFSYFPYVIRDIFLHNIKIVFANIRLMYTFILCGIFQNSLSSFNIYILVNIAIFSKIFRNHFLKKSSYIFIILLYLKIMLYLQQIFSNWYYISIRINFIQILYKTLFIQKTKLNLFYFSCFFNYLIINIFFPYLFYNKILIIIYFFNN